MINKIIKFLNAIFAPKVTIYKYTSTTVDKTGTMKFPQKEFDAVFKSMDKTFREMDKMFKKL